MTLWVQMPGLEMGSPSALVCHLSRSVERSLANPSLALRRPFTTRWCVSVPCPRGPDPVRPSSVLTLGT